jgi:hypothetical protein
MSLSHDLPAKRLDQRIVQMSIVAPQAEMGSWYFAPSFTRYHFGSNGNRYIEARGKEQLGLKAARRWSRMFSENEFSKKSFQQAVRDKRPNAPRSRESIFGVSWRKSAIGIDQRSRRLSSGPKFGKSTGDAVHGGHEIVRLEEGLKPRPW